MVLDFQVDAKVFRFEPFFSYGSLVRITERNKKGQFSMIFGRQEVIWLSAQMQDFFFKKGGDNWVKIFRGASSLLIIRVGANIGGRFISIEDTGRDGRGRRLFFPEGREATGWGKLLLALAFTIKKLFSDVGSDKEMEALPNENRLFGFSDSKLKSIEKICGQWVVKSWSLGDGVEDAGGAGAVGNRDRIKSYKEVVSMAEKARDEEGLNWRKQSFEITSERVKERSRVSGEGDQEKQPRVAQQKAEQYGQSMGGTATKDFPGFKNGGLEFFNKSRQQEFLIEGVEGKGGASRGAAWQNKGMAKMWTAGKGFKRQGTWPMSETHGMEIKGRAEGFYHKEYYVGPQFEDKGPNIVVERADTGAGSNERAGWANMKSFNDRSLPHRVGRPIANNIMGHQLKGWSGKRVFPTLVPPYRYHVRTLYFQKSHSTQFLQKDRRIMAVQTRGLSDDRDPALWRASMGDARQKNRGEVSYYQPRVHDNGGSFRIGGREQLCWRCQRLKGIELKKEKYKRIWVPKSQIRMSKMEGINTRLTEEGSIGREIEQKGELDENGSPDEAQKGLMEPNGASSTYLIPGSQLQYEGRFKREVFVKSAIEDLKEVRGDIIEEDSDSEIEEMDPFFDDGSILEEIRSKELEADMEVTGDQLERLFNADESNIDLVGQSASECASPMGARLSENISETSPSKLTTKPVNLGSSSKSQSLLPLVSACPSSSCLESKGSGVGVGLPEPAANLALHSVLTSAVDEPVCQSNFVQLRDFNESVPLDQTERCPSANEVLQLMGLHLSLASTSSTPCPENSTCNKQRGQKGWRELKGLISTVNYGDIRGRSKGEWCKV